MSFRSEVDAGSVVGAATAVSAVGARLDGVPADRALVLVAAALPGGALAAAAAAAASAAEESVECGAEMDYPASVFDRYTAALASAVESQQRLAQDAAALLAGS